MLGIDDPVILAVYLLCILSTLLCIAYGLINWNKGAEAEAEEAAEELAWEAKEEKELEA
ncbi:MAG: symporter small accessory protein [Methanotrichaceae archaeon]